MELSNINKSSVHLTSTEHSVFLRQPKHALYKPCMTLHKEQQSKLVLDRVEDKTRPASRKVIVRSSYFQHKLLKDNNVENELVSEKDATNNVFYDKTVSRIAPNGNGTENLKCATKKRPSISTERIQNVGVSSLLLSIFFFLSC